MIRLTVNCSLVAGAVAALMAVPQHSFAGASEAVLHSFGSGTDGSTPRAGLILDSTGNLYGTTSYGGVNNVGTVFKIAPDSTESVLYSFDMTHGANPESELFLDKKNNLYGTTYAGGNSSTCAGCGVVFRLKPNGSEKPVYVFTGSNGDGFGPSGGVIEAQGTFYGTTCSGGFDDEGITYSLTKDGTETVHFYFDGDTGTCPTASLIKDDVGNFYGTTYTGGENYGTVFRSTTDGDVSVLHTFSGGADGGYPRSSLLLDSAGNLYGTTQVGGQYEYGTVFKLAPDGTETILHDFTGGQDGATPDGGLISDRKGNFYGTAFKGGNCGGYCGTVFKISSKGAFKVIYAFEGGADGANPIGNLARDKSENLYGATELGGANGFGTVFKITP